MSDFTLKSFSCQEELDEIISWDEQFKDSQLYEDYNKFLFEKGFMKELIFNSYEIFAIDEDERKDIMIAKNSAGEIVGFTIQSIVELTSDSPELFLQCIVVKPDCRNRGIGKKILNNIGTATEKACGKMPVSIFTFINKKNVYCQNLFKKFGFTFSETKNITMLKAEGQTPGFGKTFE